MEGIWQAALDAARQTCDQAQPKPSKKYLWRGDKKLMELILQGKQARAEYQACADGSFSKQKLRETLQSLKQERRHLTKAIRKDKAARRRPSVV